MDGNRRKLITLVYEKDSFLHIICSVGICGAWSILQRNAFLIAYSGIICNTYHTHYEQRLS